MAQQTFRSRRVADTLTTLTADARRLHRLRRDMGRAVGAARRAAEAALADCLAQSQAAVAARREKLPKPEFQPDLPVNEKRADIAELIANN